MGKFARDRCDRCQLDFISKKEFCSHIKKSHMNDMVPCPHCTKVFLSSNSVNIHVKQSHMKIRNHACSQCDKAFFSSSGLRVHVKSVHDKIKDVQCLKCPSKFSRKCDLNKHVRNVHYKGTFPCTRCDYIATTRDRLDLHIGNRHSRLIFECIGCDEMFATSYHLSFHYDKVHAGKSRSELECSYCPRIFSAVRKRLYHEQTMHVNGEFYKCNICPYQSLHPSNLLRHKQQSHQIKTEYELRMTCGFCNEEFENSKTMRFHIMKVHKISNLGRHKCDYCSRFFVHSYNRSRHVRQQHNKHQCRVCNFAALTVEEVRLHSLEVHEAKDRFVCDVCYLSYKTSSCLKRHKMRKHIDAKKCSLCEFVTMEQEELDQHFSTHFTFLDDLLQSTEPILFDESDQENTA